MKGKKILAAAAAALMALSVTACSTTKTTSQPAERTDTQVIEEIITYHGCYGDEADIKVQELLGELTTIDAREAKLWTDIMNYWHYANTDLVVNVDKLPDDLPQDDSLVLVVLGFELNDDGVCAVADADSCIGCGACMESCPNGAITDIADD